MKRDNFIYIVILVLAIMFVWRIATIEEKVASLEDVVFNHSLYKQIEKGVE